MPGMRTDGYGRIGPHLFRGRRHQMRLCLPLQRAGRGPGAVGMGTGPYSGARTKIGFLVEVTPWSRDLGAPVGANDQHLVQEHSRSLLTAASRLELQDNTP